MLQYGQRAIEITAKFATNRQKTGRPPDPGGPPSAVSRRRRGPCFFNLVAAFRTARILQGKICETEATGIPFASAAILPVALNGLGMR